MKPNLNGRDCIMKKALLLDAKVAIPLPDAETATYERAITYLMPILSSPEFINLLIEDDHLDDDEFNGKPYRFKWCGYRNYALEYDFEYAGDEDEDDDEYEDVVTVRKNMDFIKIF